VAESRSFIAEIGASPAATDASSVKHEDSAAENVVVFTAREASRRGTKLPARLRKLAALPEKLAATGSKASRAVT
jgi:hypothetical protein